ncbi:MAG: hypothetical protein AAF290_02075 [Pseudomonadota bacterium]
MSRLWISLGVVLFAGVLVWLVHRLRRKAKQTVAVATLAPFAEATRVRAHLASVEQRWLLLTRLCLLAALAWLTWMPDNHDDRINGDRILAVKPGTPLAEYAELLTTFDRAVWLTKSLPTLAGAPTPQADGHSLAALIALEQRIAPSAALTVVGHWSAHEWPISAPRWTRPIEFIDAGTSVGAAFDRPDSIYLVGFQASSSAALAEIVGQWLAYPLAGYPVAVNTQAVLPDARETDIWVVADRSVPLPATHEWAASLSIDGAEELNAMPAETLWERMTAALMREPPRPSPVTTQGSTTASILPGRKTPEAPPVPIVWLTLIAALFVLERLLSAMRPTR